MYDMASLAREQIPDLPLHVPFDTHAGFSGYRNRTKQKNSRLDACCFWFLLTFPAIFFPPE